MKKKKTGNAVLKGCLRKVQSYLEAGDPVEAESAMEFAFRATKSKPITHELSKINEEITIGNPERAEQLLQTLRSGLGFSITRK